MTRKLHVDGNTGKAYIYNNDLGPAVYATPANNQLGDLYFHSDLSYLGGGQIISATVQHPQRTRSSNSNKWGTYFQQQTGEQTFNLAANSFGAVVPFIASSGGSQLPAGTPIHQVGESIRAVSIYLDASQIRVYERWTTFDDTLPAVTRTYQVVLFQTLFTGVNNKAIEITVNDFQAGFGKLAATYRYVRESQTPDFFIGSGKTADVSGGGLKVVLPDGSTAIQSSSYTGSFSGSGGRGAEI